jgi:glycosyltransferase involved in cell wall biosynthesis
MASKRPRIVHLITRLELGGAQQNTLYCVEHHDRGRFAVGLWAGRGGILDDDARSIRDADVRLLPWLAHEVDPSRDVAAVARLATRLVDVDLVHTHSSKAGILGRLAARVAGVRCVVHTVHGWSFNDVQPARTRRTYVELERAAARLTDRIVCVSDSDRVKGLAHGIGEPWQYRVLRSGIDPTLYLPRAGAGERVRSALGFGASDVVVGSIANFKPQKAPLDFVEAARRALLSSPRLKFFLAGDGEMRAEVTRAIDAAGLRDAIRLLGWRQDVPDLLAATDVFLLTSLFEGLPRAVLQAMAAAVPVVVTDTGGTAEVVVDGVTGYLVPSSDPGAAAAAVVRLAAEPEKRKTFGTAGRMKLGAEFDIRRMVPTLEALYDELLERHDAPAGHATSASHLGSAAARH